MLLSLSETFTVTTHEAVNPPSIASAVMTAYPIAFAVTLPFVPTVAIFSLLLLHITDFIEAVSGETIAVSVSLLPFTIAALFMFSVMPAAASYTAVS
jgi:hypothetical protein